MPEGGKRSILVIDGDLSLLFYLGMLLTRLGYDVATSRSAEEALRMMEDAVPSLVVTDLALPKMSGMNLLLKMREKSSFRVVPVIILASETDPGIRDTCLRAGCAAYLAKPVEPDALYCAAQAATETCPRQNIRLDTSLKVVVGDDSVLGGTARTEYVTALSEGGMFVRTLYPQPVNTLTPVRFRVGEREVKARAVVLYTFSVGEGPFKEPGMGMRFEQISSEDRMVIKDFIKNRLTGDITQA